MKYNPIITIAWIANTDASSYTDLKAVITYLAKYYSKAEKKSERFIDIGIALLPRIQEAR